MEEFVISAISECLCLRFVRPGQPRGLCGSAGGFEGGEERTRSEMRAKTPTPTLINERWATIGCINMAAGDFVSE